MTFCRDLRAMPQNGFCGAISDIHKDRKDLGRAKLPSNHLLYIGRSALCPSLIWCSHSLLSDPDSPGFPTQGLQISERYDFSHPVLCWLYPHEGIPDS